VNPLGNGGGTPLMPVNPMLLGLSETIRFAQTFRSPEAFMQELQKQNPQMYQYLLQLSQQVRNPMETAVQMLNQQGISPQHLASLLNRN
jgi:hypothetical protein